MAGGLDGIVQGSDNVLSVIQFAILMCPPVEILSDGETGNGDVVTINQFVFEKERKNL